MAVLSPDYLCGEWAVRRAVNADPEAFTGTARFTPDGAGGLEWHETGRLRLAGYAGAAHRTLRLDAREVRFDDGRPFHPLREGAFTHRCGPDTYRGTWTVHDRDRFTVRWGVSGPGREDLIVSEYVRCDPPAPDREPGVTDGPAPAAATVRGQRWATSGARR